MVDLQRRQVAVEESGAFPIHAHPEPMMMRSIFKKLHYVFFTQLPHGAEQRSALNYVSQIVLLTKGIYILQYVKQHGVQFLEPEALILSHCYPLLSTSLFCPTGRTDKEGKKPAFDGLPVKRCR